MQIVILTDYARNPLLICPMGFVFSLYYYYIGQFVKIENIAILEHRKDRKHSYTRENIA